MNIQEIRKMYPQYDDLSDTEISDKLHRKYYADLPKSDFLTKIGIPAVKDEALQPPDFEPTDLITLPKMAKLGVTMGAKALGEEGIELLGRQYAKNRFKVGSKLLGEEKMTRYITNKNIDEMLEEAFKRR